MASKDDDLAVRPVVPELLVEALGACPPTPLAVAGPARYSVFSPGIKVLVIALSSGTAAFAPLSSTIFVPVIPLLAHEFHRSEQDISLAVTVYLVFMALAPTLFGSMSDYLGRRPAYLATLTVFTVANIGLAQCPTESYWLLLVLRALQAIGGSPVIAIGAGCISDIAEPHERGKYMSYFVMGAMIGTSFGPLIGGITSQYLGWRWIFWLLAIMSGSTLAMLALTFPETLRGLFQPFSSITLLRTPEITLVFLVVAVLFFEYFAVLTVYPTTLKEAYGLTEIQIGLCYLPNGIGSVVASIISGRWTDAMYRKEAVRAGGDYRTKGDAFRLERVRMVPGIPSVVLFVVGCLAQGWCLQVSAPLAATLVTNFFTGMNNYPINLATLYGQDLEPAHASAVSASLNVIRCLFAAVGTAIVMPLRTAIGVGHTFVVFSGLSFLSMPLCYVVVRLAPGWRKRRTSRPR